MGLIKQLQTTNISKLTGTEAMHLINELSELVPTQALFLIERFVPKELHTIYALNVTLLHNRKGYINECKKS